MKKAAREAAESTTGQVPCSTWQRGRSERVTNAESVAA